MVNHTPGAVYKGLAISDFQSGAQKGTLYATNFRAGTIDAFDSSFNQTLMGDFVDPNLPAGYAPFNDRAINGELYVTYAVQDALKHDDVKGPGNGIVDIFNLNGSFDERLISNGSTSALNSPWGMEIAPSSFGQFAGDLLVGNFGDGKIHAYNATTGAFLGTLDRANGQPLVIDGLWALTIGNGVWRKPQYALFHSRPQRRKRRPVRKPDCGSRALDLGDDAARLRGLKLCGLSPRRQGPAGDRINRSVLERQAAQTGGLFRLPGTITQTLASAQLLSQIRNSTIRLASAE